MKHKHHGFTLIELMIVVAIIAIIAAIAIPGLIRARIASNETSAIGTLKCLCTCQQQFKNAVIVDQDGDGIGEYGWLQEICGVSSYRILGGLSTAPVAPPFCPPSLGVSARENGGIAEQRGYGFLMYLPTFTGPAVRETSPIPTFGPADADPQEVRFVCYAFPLSLGLSGNRTFAVNQECELFTTPNNGHQNYDLNNIPPPGAAYVASGSEDPNNLEGRFITGTPATDGYLWLPAGN